MKYLLFIICIVTLATSCVTYKRYPLPQSRLKVVDNTALKYYLLDAAHPSSTGWYMSDVRIDSTKIECYLSKLTKEETKEIFAISSRRDARWSKNDVLFYAKPVFASAISDSLTATINLRDLERIEVYEINQMRTLGTPLITIAGLTYFLFLIDY